MTAMQLPPTERRCEKCQPGTNYREHIDYCPRHGGTVKPMLKRVCLCGYDGNETSYEFCVKCGKVLENNHA